MIKNIIISTFLVTGIFLTACTPREIQIFNTLTPAQQESVKKDQAQKVQLAKYKITSSRDCYGAIAIYWPASLQPWARSIVWRESRNTPTAANPTSSARGCFQMLLRYSAPFYARVGCTNAMWSNATCNVRAAYEMYKVAGKSPWRL